MFFSIGVRSPSDIRSCGQNSSIRTESSLEEWLAGQRKSGVPEDDVAAMLAGMGLLDQFDSLFVRRLDYLWTFFGNVAQNIVEPPLEVEMGCSYLYTRDLGFPCSIDLVTCKIET